MFRRLLPLLLCLPLCGQVPPFRELMRGSPRLPLKPAELPVQAPGPGWSIEMVSSVAVDRGGAIYLLQRGAHADPVLVVNRKGAILRSWGKGLYKMPHSIRVDPDGNIWTVDAGDSTVRKFTPQGKELLKIDVGGVPTDGTSEFRGTTDIAFAPGPRIFISDGYGTRASSNTPPRASASASGARPEPAPDSFTCRTESPSTRRTSSTWRIARMEGSSASISTAATSASGTVLGKTFSLKITPSGDFWIGTQPRDAPNGKRGWIVKVNRKDGAIIGVVESAGTHSIEVNAEGQPLTGARPDKVLWFR